MSLPAESYRRHVFATAAAERQFGFFRQLNHPHFGLCARVDVTRLRASAKTSGLGLHLACVHALTAAANAVPSLRRRVRRMDGEEVVVEHAAVHPSFTVPGTDTGAFGFCEVGYVPDALAFAGAARDALARVADDPRLEDQPDRDDYLFLSAIPWVDFTGIQHAMQYHPHDCVPRISWGKVVPRLGGGEEMSVSIQAHHALVDGRGVGDFFAALEAYIGSCQKE